MQNKVIFNNSKWEKLSWDFFSWWLFSKCAIIMCHNEKSSKEWKTYKKLASTFSESQIPNLKFDFSWFWESEWNPTNFDISKWKNDILSAINYLKSQWIEKVILFWDRLWATIALRSALWNNDVVWLVLVSPWNENENFMELFDVCNWYDKQVFIVHGWEDKIVDISLIDRLVQKMNNASVEPIRWADHEFSNDREYIKMYNLVAEYLFNIYNKNI